MGKGVTRQSIGQCAALLALMLAATPATAQIDPRPLVQNFAKSEAILGGSPSRLAAILAQQQGIRAVSAPASTPLQPASLSVRTPGYSVLRNLPSSPTAASSGRPDVFGSVALSINRTPLDRRWRKVARGSIGPCSNARCFYP